MTLFLSKLMSGIMELSHSLCHSFYHLVNLEQEKGRFL